MSKLLLVLLSAAYVSGCYWNSECPHRLYGSKTPYDTVRGDIRDFPTPPNCQAVSVWSINRHGNRNPGTSVTVGMRRMVPIKDEIIASFDAGNSSLCAQDVDMFRNWSWNSTLESSQSYLTGTGYEELYDIGKRIREKYPHLLRGNAEDFYFRPTNEQRTITSCTAFVHGFTDGQNLTVTVDEARLTDDIIRPYENCDRYQQDVRNGPTLASQLDSFFSSAQYISLVNAVQERLAIPTRLSPENVFSMYEMCRFYRSWTPELQSPWCGIFTERELTVLEYYDDVRHFYRNGYGSWVNEHLGRLPMKDLYDNFEAVIQGGGHKVVSYFTHDTMIEMVICALGLYRDNIPLQALVMDPDRVWRSSYIGAFSSNLIAVLNSCMENGSLTYRVQIFLNERVSPLCPRDGCTWQEFQSKFQRFSSANLDFCSMDYVHDIPQDEPSTNSASPLRGFLNW